MKHLVHGGKELLRCPTMRLLGFGFPGKRTGIREVDESVAVFVEQFGKRVIYERVFFNLCCLD